MTRTKKALANASAELCLELVTAICAFVLPRLILSNYGSASNGIISSITQFIGCIVILKSGIGSVTRAALYKPLVEKNTEKISEITNASSQFIKRIAIIFAIATIIFAAIYPSLIGEDYQWSFVFTLVLIIASSTFAQYFFGLTYQIVLEADQKNYIISIVTIISTILNTIISSILIILGYEIRFVKLASAIIFIIPPIFYNLYVKKKYKINLKVKPNKKLIEQRWDAFGHQIASFINTNTDIIVTTVILGVKEVSVYSVFYLIGHAIQRTIKAFSVGATAALGDMIARNETKNLRKSFLQYEFLMIYISTIIIATAIATITSFISLYTKGITDVNYIRNDFGILMCIATFLTGLKLPYDQLIHAAGEFKKTKKYAITEAILNIITSVSLALIIGLNGIIIGTIIATIYKIVTNYNFICSNVILKNKIDIYRKLLYSAICFMIVTGIGIIVPVNQANTYAEWGLWACLITVISIVVSTLLAMLFMKEDFISTMHKMKNIVKK